MPVHSLVSPSLPSLTTLGRGGKGLVSLGMHSVWPHRDLLREREKLSGGRRGRRARLAHLARRRVQHSNSLSMAPASSGTAAFEGAAAANTSIATPPSGHGGQSPLPDLAPELLERMTPHVHFLRMIKLLDEAGVITHSSDLDWAHRVCYSQMYADIRAFESTPSSRKRCR